VQNEVNGGEESGWLRAQLIKLTNETREMGVRKNTYAHAATVLY
jgi:hypothetical protein